MLKNIEFIKSAFDMKNLPSQGLPEVLLCGRSNVGKSSFINSLFNKKNLAKTSSTPGKTRSLNFYLVDSFFLVDLPGFGYAKVSKEERDHWNKIISEYFSSGRNIAYAFHLIDSRHEPTALDIRLNEYLRSSSIPYSVVLNKIDKLNQSELARAKNGIRNIFPELLFEDNLFTYSTINNTGKKEILQRLNVLFKK